MRRFRLLKDNGATVLDITQKGGMFFSDPKGLGFSESVNTTQIGDAFVYNSSKLAQEPISGTMNFPSYASYRLFAEFCTMEELDLEYTPTDTPYRRKVRLKKLTKTEIGEGGWLRCDVEFVCLSDWLIIKNPTYTRTGNKWVYSLSNNSPKEAGLEITISNLGDLSLTIQELSLVTGGGDVILDSEYPITDFITDAFYLNTSDGNPQILNDHNGQLVNIIDKIKMSENIFVKAPKGTSTLTIQMTGDAFVSVRTHEEYRTL